MMNYKEIIRIAAESTSQRQIASSLRSSRNKVSEVLELAKTYGLTWPLDEPVTNEQLEAILFPNRYASDNAYLTPYFAYIHKELAKPKVTLTLLWDEYRRKAETLGKRPYMPTQFGDKYRAWARVTKATMRIHHKPGDAMEVDWAGQTLPIYDSVTGESYPVYLFIAVLSCSGYTYAEATSDMKLENWLNCHIHAYEYFGGATRLLIPDNLKTGVIKNTRYETVLNRSYQELAEYYDTAIVPARVEHPNDKSHAEGTVRFASTWILAALRNEHFFTLTEAKEAVSLKLEELNTREFKQREGCRKSAYLEEEKAYMKPLPYIDLKWNQSILGFNSTDLLVKPSIAKAQIEKEKVASSQTRESSENAADLGSAGITGQRTSGSESGSSGNTANGAGEYSAPSNKHFFMSAEVDPVRVNKVISTYVDEIIRHLMQVNGAAVELKLDVDVIAPDGIPASTVRTVSENCKTLKITDFGFEE